MPWKEAQWPLSPLVLLSARSALLPSKTGCLWVRLCAQECTCMRKPSECPCRSQVLLLRKVAFQKETPWHSGSN